MGVSPACVSFTNGVGFFHGNAVRTDVCEEWTVPTASDTIFTLDNRRRDAAVFQKAQF